MSRAPFRIPNPESRVRGLETRWVPVAALLFALLFGAGCVVGPNYKRPTATVPPAYKEGGGTATQASTQNLQEKWWEVFGDPQLNALEEQVKISNENLKASEAQYRQARDLVRFYRAEYYPTGTVSPSISRIRNISTTTPASALSGQDFY